MNLRLSLKYLIIPKKKAFFCDFKSYVFLNKNIYRRKGSANYLNSLKNLKSYAKSCAQSFRPFWDIQKVIKGKDLQYI